MGLKLWVQILLAFAFGLAMGLAFVLYCTFILP